MAWLAVQIQHYNMEPREEEVMFSHKPERLAPTGSECKLWVRSYGDSIILPKGSIKKLIGRELKWEDDPVEIK